MRRREILDAAAVLFSKKGYAKVSVEEIAAQAGLGKATLYHYFKGRDQMLVEMHAAAGDQTLQAAARIRESQLTPREALRANMIEIVRFIRQQPGYLQVFFGHYHELSKPALEEVAAKRDGYAEYIEELIKEAIAQGEFREVDPRTTMLAIFGMCNWTYQWAESRKDLSAEQIGNAFADLVFTGLEKPQS